MLSKPLHKTTCARVWFENRKTIQPLGFNIHFLHFTTISVIGQRFLTPKHLIIMNYKVLLLYRKLKYRLRYIFLQRTAKIGKRNGKVYRNGRLWRNQNLNLMPKKSREKKKTNSVFVSEFVFFICGGRKRSTIAPK